MTANTLCVIKKWYGRRETNFRKTEERRKAIVKFPKEKDRITTRRPYNCVTAKRKERRKAKEKRRKETRKEGEHPV